MYEVLMLRINRVPLAGGQYSMVSEYAPPGATQFLSYITGKCS